jgi:hypothetical protein
MSESSSQEPDQQTGDATRDFIVARAKAGASREAIVNELVQRGYDAAAARDLVGGIAKKQAVSTRTAGMWYLIGGLAITALSIAMTVSSYEAAEAGGTYVICWGSAIFGVVLAIRGIRQLLTGREAK